LLVSHPKEYREEEEDEDLPRYRDGDIPGSFERINITCPTLAAIPEESSHSNSNNIGNPNGTGLPEWPKYNSQKNMVMILSAHPNAERLPHKDALDFLFEHSPR